MAVSITRAQCQALDDSDPLAPLRARFSLPEGVIYLDGNSLGARSQSAMAVAKRVIEREWGVGLIRSWTAADWIDGPLRVGTVLARLLGAAEGQVLVTDSTTANLFKLLTAALHHQAPRRVVLLEEENFPADNYIAQGVARAMAADVELRRVPGADLEHALDEDVAVVVASHVNYRSGVALDMAGINARAAQVGALTLWDLAHSAGVLDVRLDETGADLAVGCGYKYLNGGPGAPAFLYVARRHQRTLQSPMAGWMGHAQPFEFGPDYEPAPGILRFACGTPGIVGLSLLEDALDQLRDVAAAELQAKASRMVRTFIELVRERCPEPEMQRLGPDEFDDGQRGGHVTITHPQGYGVVQALIARQVIPDFRAPGGMRFGFAPAYTSFVDLWDAVQHLREVLDGREYDDPCHQTRSRVT
ncbi:MAG: kynureninase [Myxococcota bacterium]